MNLRYDFYEKAVTFKPYQVDMLDPVTANFLGDNLRCWMQIQVTFKAIPIVQCHFMEIQILTYIYSNICVCPVPFHYVTLM